MSRKYAYEKALMQRCKYKQAKSHTVEISDGYARRVYVLENNEKLTGHWFRIIDDDHKQELLKEGKT